MYLSLDFSWATFMYLYLTICVLIPTSSWSSVTLLLISRAVCIPEFGFQLGYFYVLIFDHMCINSDKSLVFRNVIIDKSGSVYTFNFPPVAASIH